MGQACPGRCAIGTIPARLTRPSVGLIPTIPFADDGQTIEPSVSVPMATAHMFAETEAPDPELEPHGFRSSTYGFLACPPRPLQPLDECVDRKFAHSLRFVLPSRIAPAARSLAAIVASLRAIDPASGEERA